jgi:hypothetical protein
MASEERIRIERPTEERLEELKVDTWSPWECGVETFDWEYGTTETAYVKEGKVRVVTEGGQEVQIAAGDLVVFPRGVRCTWEVQEPIRKVFTFD